MGNTRRFLPDNIRGGTSDGTDPLTSAHRQRVKLFSTYWNYYNGHHLKHLKMAPNSRTDDNITENWSRRIVNEGLRFLLSELPIFREDDDETNVTEAEKWMKEYWQTDPVRDWSPFKFLHTMGQNGFVCGTPFIKLMPKPDKTVELRAIDPAMVDIETNPDDIEMVTAYNIIWKRGDIWHRQRFERVYSEADGTTANWLTTEADYMQGRWAITFSETWPYQFAPLFHTHNLVSANNVWGTSDLEDADLNDAINFANSNINRILRFHAHPKTIGTGFSAKQIEQTAVDELWTISGPDAKVFNLEMQSDLASSRAHASGMVDAFHEISAVPRLDPTNVNVGALSGFALRILYGPLLSKTRVKQETYGMLLAQVNRAMLEIAGMPNIAVKVRWPEPLPSSDTERDTRLSTLVGAGASLEGAAKIVGYSEAEIQELVNGSTVERFTSR